MTPVEETTDISPVRRHISTLRIFLAFLAVGATSFGGSVVPHLRRVLVGRQWIDDHTFTELLAISQVLPGLNAANLAVLVGDRLGSTIGAIAAIGGLCMPGTIFMYGAGIAYRLNGQRPLVAAALAGVAAAALGLTLATTSQLGRKSFTSLPDLALIALTLVGVSVLNIFEPLVLFGVGVLAIGWYGIRKTRGEGARM